MLGKNISKVLGHGRDLLPANARITKQNVLVIKKEITG
jgi:hypothetical protein